VHLSCKIWSKIEKIGIILMEKVGFIKFIVNLENQNQLTSKIFIPDLNYFIFTNENHYFRVILKHYKE
jgi:hypothetical protein